jgi:RNA polymerase sigma-70 factor (ECF subfamily)
MLTLRLSERIGLSSQLRSPQPDILRSIIGDGEHRATPALAANRLGSYLLPMPQPDDSVSRALETVLARFAERVRRIGMGHGLSGGDVEDLVQEVRLRLWRALETGENILAAPASYVHRTAVSAAIDLLRRRRARRETPARLSRPSGEAILGEAPAPDLTLEGSEVVGQVAAAVDGLAEGRRAVVRMYLAGYGREEIAQLLGWSEPKTRNLLYRGLADLRARLTEMGIGPESVP